MENFIVGLLFVFVASSAFSSAYHALKNKRGFWVSFSGLKSEKNPTWFAFIQGFVALLFGLFILYLGVRILLR